MQMLHGSHLKASIKSSISFPAGFDITEFADEDAPHTVYLEDDRIAVIVPAFSSAAENLAVMVGKREIVQMSVTYPCGKTVNYANGISEGAARLDEETSEFLFHFNMKSPKTPIQKDEALTIEAAPVGVTLH